MDLERIRETYANMTESEIRHLYRYEFATLTDEAMEILLGEFRRRGIDPNVHQDPPARKKYTYSMLGDRISKPSSSQAVVFRNIVKRADFQFIDIGDIILTGNDFYFIPYGQYKSSAPMMTAAAALFLGVAGAVAEKLSDSSLNNALPYANYRRLQDWGMTAKEIACKHKHHELIAKDEIIDFETGPGLILKTKNKQTLGFGRPFREEVDYGEVFFMWFKGETLPRDVFLKVALPVIAPTPSALLRVLLTENALPSSELIEKLSADDIYMAVFSRIFFVSVSNKQDKIRLMELFTKMPKIFKAQLVKNLKGDFEKKKGFATQWFNKKYRDLFQKLRSEIDIE